MCNALVTNIWPTSVDLLTGAVWFIFFVEDLWLERQIQTYCSWLGFLFATCRSCRLQLDLDIKRLRLDDDILVLCRGFYCYFQVDCV